MQVGLFFGSFNPVHIGHLIIADSLLNFTELEEIWFIVSPQSPQKRRSLLAGIQDRLQMARLATADNPRILISDVETRFSQPSYSIDTINYLKASFAENNFSVLMGADNLATLHTWKNAAEILTENKIYVYPRPGFPIMPGPLHKNIVVTQTPYLELSATFIRKSIRQNKSVRYLLPEKVLNYIAEHDLYK